MQRIFGGDAATMASLNAFSEACDVTANGGDACTDSYFQGGLAQLQQTCGQQPATCSKTCRSFLNGFWQTCRARVDQLPPSALSLHDLCTGGGGH
jgi:hypothetical protein